MKKILCVVLLLVSLCLNGCSSKDELSLEVTKEETMPVLAGPDDTIAESKALDQSEDSGLSFVVYVCGAVNKPGVYELSEGSRLFDAISIAGGYAGDAADGSLNLARLITDEEMIYVPTMQEIEEGYGYGAAKSIESSSKSEEKNSGLINLNTATVADLMTLPGIGESKANLIISYRDENGPFSAPTDIMLVRGIKDGLYNKVKDYICVK